MAPRAPFAPGSTNTGLDLLTEAMFRKWTADNRVPFNADAPASDYDMRGFYRALQQGNPMAQSSVNPNDNQMHYPDYWKNPGHQTFSSESQFAGPDAPSWINDSQLAAPSGRILYDEANPPVTMGTILGTR
jgi:hypothetical protein